MIDFKESVKEYIEKEIPQNSEIMYGTNYITRSEERTIDYISIPIVHKKIIIEWREVEKAVEE